MGPGSYADSGAPLRLITPRRAASALLAVVVIILFFNASTLLNTSNFGASDDEQRMHMPQLAKAPAPAQSSPAATEHVSTPHQEPEFRDSLDDISNSTLGFDRIIVIGLSERMDKRDSMVTGASFHNLSLDWIEGVKPKDIPDKAYPAGWDKNRNMPDEIGCWRAHINVFQKMVAENIQSALILEDDADWDMTVRAQLKEFARGAREFQPKTANPAPYGDDWDLLWLGHCAIGTDQDHLYVIPNDITARPTSHRADFWWPDISEREDLQGARLVFDKINGLCTHGYAISYKAARKLLAVLSMEPNNDTIDTNFQEICRPNNKENIDFRCIAPYPGILNQWRKAGSASRDSDIHSNEDEWHEAHSITITYSTMLNAHRLANGSDTALAQWDDVVPQEIDWKNHQLPRGKMMNFELTRNDED